jgi:hypothetical protein
LRLRAGLARRIKPVVSVAFSADTSSRASAAALSSPGSRRTIASTSASICSVNAPGPPVSLRSQSPVDQKSPPFRSKCFVCDGDHPNETLIRMSRGNGRIQRDLIVALEKQDRLVDTFELAADVYGVEPNSDGVLLVTDAMVTSVRRALRKLAAEGRVFRITRGSNKRGYWTNERLGLWYTIRSMQIEMLGFRETSDATAHAARMLPLINRAHALGVDINKLTFP